MSLFPCLIILQLLNLIFNLIQFPHFTIMKQKYKIFSKWQKLDLVVSCTNAQLSTIFVFLVSCSFDGGLWVSMGEMGYPVLGSVGGVEYLPKQIPAFGIAEGGADGVTIGATDGARLAPS